MPRFVILHTNDLHNHLKQPVADRVRRLKAFEENCLLLDAGDAISAGNITFRPGGEPILELMSGVGYDAMALGNREFHFMQAGLKAKLSSARFPVLSANLRRAKLRVALPVQPYLIKRLPNDLRIAVLGLTVPMVTERMLSRRVSSYVFDDPVETAARLAPVLKRKADVLVALTHIGLKEDLRLAAAVRGIDVIVGGHSHDLLREPQTVGRTKIVQAGWFGHHIGRAEVCVVAQEPPQVSASVIPLGD